MIETRNGERLNAIVLNVREWCFFTSANGIRYAVHNVRGKMKVFKNDTQEVRPTKEIRKAVSLA